MATTKKTTTKKIRYSEPAGYYPKEIRDRVFGKTDSKKKKDKK